MKTIEQVTAECAQRLAECTEALASIQLLTREALELYAAGELDEAFKRIDKAYHIERDAFENEVVTGTVWDQIVKERYRPHKETP